MIFQECKLSLKINKAISKYKKKNDITISIYLKKNDNELFLGNNDLYDIGSISKVFTALYIIDLIKENKISLKTKLDDILKLPEGLYPKVEDLLTHSAGYRHLTPVKFTVPSLLIHRYRNHNPYEGVNRDKLLQEVIKRNKRISNRYCYSDFAYAILALVIEEVTSNSFYNSMNEYLKNKGMNDSSCVDDLVVRKSKNNWNWEKDNPYLASGGILSNIKDLSTFSKELLKEKDGLIFKPKDHHNLVFFTTPKQHLFWHVGGVGYFRSAILLNPRRNVSVVVLGNGIGKRGANPYYISKLIYTAIRRNKVNWENNQ